MLSKVCQATVGHITLTAEKLANQRPINNNMGHSLMFQKETNARTCDVA